MLFKFDLVEKPAKTQTSIGWLAIQLERLTQDLKDMSLNPLCGGEIGALTKSGKTHGVRSFYSGDTDVIT